MPESRLPTNYGFSRGRFFRSVFRVATPQRSSQGGSASLILTAVDADLWGRSIPRSKNGGSGQQWWAAMGENLERNEFGSRRGLFRSRDRDTYIYIYTYFFNINRIRLNSFSFKSDSKSIAHSVFVPLLQAGFRIMTLTDAGRKPWSLSGHGDHGRGGGNCWWKKSG